MSRMRMMVGMDGRDGEVGGGHVKRRMIGRGGRKERKFSQGYHSPYS
jgi:hypothetical protein